MLKRFSILCLVFILFAGIIKGQEPIKIPLNRIDKKHPGKEIIETHTNKIILYEDVDEFYVHQKQTKDGGYHQISAPGLSRSFDKGNPDLPVISRLIEIPFDSKVEVLVLNYDTETIDLNDYQISNKIIPAQPSINKSTDPKDVPFYKNRDLYKKNSFYKKEIVQFQDKGYLRNKHLGYIEISPFQYNPVTNTLKILRNIEIEISFVSNNTKNAGNFNRLQSPFFENLDLNTINKATEQESTKALIEGPVKYVIVSDPMFEETLQPFIEWKTQKGFHVITAYTDNPDVGTTTTSIKNYLQDLYENPDDNVSPTFVLFVGDVDQIPAFDGDAGSHVTDLYYCEYTGDNLPEVFYGRFSATSFAELQPQIDKTLEVEKYQIPDPSYLDNVVLVAGVDGTYAPTHGNGAIHYANNNYTNETNGITSYYYLYNDDSGVMSSDSSGASESIKNYISQGVSFSNYTAHCNSDGWGDPSFTNSDVPNMTNENMYPLMIGNCCLSNKFDSNAFGEVLLRAQNKGAVGYIGGSNNTYWDEDYWWAIGMGTVTVDPTYEETGLGAYDKYFHLNGEPKEKWYITQGQMIVAGNLAVEASTSSRKKYYWEIYHLMGDPSLTPFITVPETLTASYDSQVFVGTNSFTVNAEEDAYVAVSRDGVLLDAKLVDASGTVTLHYNELETIGVLGLVITKQNKQPVIDEIDVVPATTPYIVLDNYIIHDNNGNGNRLVDYGEEITFDIQVKNASDTYDAFEVEGTLTTIDSNTVITDSLENFGTVLRSDSAKANSAFTVHFPGIVEDQQEIKFELNITGKDSGDVTYEWNSLLNVTINAPIITIDDLIINDELGNDNGYLDPGEDIELQLIVSNLGHSAITNLIGKIELLGNTKSFISIVNGETTPFTLESQQSDTLVLDVFVHSDVEPGEKVFFSFTVQDTDFEHYSTTTNNEQTIGEIPEILISDQGIHNIRTAYFYDSGGKDGDYSNNEKDTITFFPLTEGKFLIADFFSFNVEENSSGGCWDNLEIYDGSDTNADLIGVFCNENTPTTISSTNSQGALTFVFNSDESEIRSGWGAEIYYSEPYDLQVLVNVDNGPLENAIVKFNNTSDTTSSNGLVTFEDVQCGINKEIEITASAYESIVGTVNIFSDTLIDFTLSKSKYDITFGLFEDDRVTKVNGEVTFNGLTKQTTNGKVTFKDVYYELQKEFRINASGFEEFVDFIDVSSTKSINVYLTPLKCDIEFIVTNGKDPLAMALVEFDAKEQKTDELGIVLFNDVRRSQNNSYTIRKSGYKNVEGFIDVENDTTINIVMETGTATFKVSFEVSDNISHLEGAGVAFNNDTLYTDNNGMAIFNNVAEATNINYEITKDHFYPVVDSFDVTGDNITEEVFMEQVQYRITFNVTDGTEPIESATIIHNDKNEYTDKNGEFVFEITYALNQEFSIKKSGYNQTDTIIDVDKEKTIIIILDKTVGIEKNPDTDIKVYPNPTDGLINIEISGAEIKNYTVKIYDVLGKLVYNKNLEGHKNIREQIGLSKLSKGLYFLNIRGDNGNIVSKRIIIK